MAIGTFSKFYYGTQITLTSSKIDINEGGGELTGTLDLGVYSLSSLAVELQQELNAIGANNYVVGFDRNSRIFTITSDGSFDLLISTGTNASSGAYDVFGFSGGVDLTGLSAYSGTVGAGSEYITQFPPQNYVAPDFRKEKGDASVNQSAAGQVEVISFGEVRFIEMDLLFITDLPMDGKVIRNNPTGAQDAIDFLTFATKRGAIEFMPDKDDPATFNEVILESTIIDKNGTKFKLNEETGKNLPGIYKTGKIEFRIVEQ
jgi:hypothetical protein